ncbi:MAG: barstar family protein [Clostridia bacterium]|nr:barstar family protein [Clostridia bacterium]
MKSFVLDGRRMADREAMHTHLAETLGLPEYYGRNLDALWDCLSEAEPAVLSLTHMEMADRECLAALTGLLSDLVREDPVWRVTIAMGETAEKEPATEGKPCVFRRIGKFFGCGK